MPDKFGIYPDGVLFLGIEGPSSVTVGRSRDEDFDDPTSQQNNGRCWAQPPVCGRRGVRGRGRTEIWIPLVCEAGVAVES